MTRLVPAGPSLLSCARAAVLVSACVSLIACSKSGSADGDSADYVVPAAAYGDEAISFKQLSATEAAAAANNAGTPQSDPNFSGGAAAPLDPGGDFALEPEPFAPPGAGGASGIVPTPVVMPEPTAPPVTTAPPTNDAGPPTVDAGGPLMSDAGATTDAGARSGDAGARSGDAGQRSSDAGAPLVFSVLAQELPAASPQPENPFRVTETMAASTFSIDVDTASYTLARSALNQGVLPNPSTVRVEEFINYFHMHYAQPTGETPFSIYSELGDCPWNPDHRLMMVGIQGQEVPLVDQPAANLVFLLDVSGSMNDPNKLPLLKSGFRMLTRQLRPIDKVSIVTYAGADRVVLEGVRGDQKDTILTALDNLTAGGSTNGEGGIQRAYAIAQEHFITGGNNRVLLATDGDFNVGLSTAADLTQLIAGKRDTGVFFSVYGFGSPLGNFQDQNAEALANNGNGIYFFIDGPEEARRAFIHTVTGSLLTVAKDMKLQVEFNAEQVKAYRLIGYENRVLNNADFSNDSVDAGELGAGLSVTAFFEIIPGDSALPIPSAIPGTDPLEGLEPAAETAAPTAPEPVFEPVTGKDFVEVRIRYKGRDATVSELVTGRYQEKDLSREEMTRKFAFASAVAELAMQLRGSQYLPDERRETLREQAAFALPAQVDGAVQQFVDLAVTAHQLQ